MLDGTFASPDSKSSPAIVLSFVAATNFHKRKRTESIILHPGSKQWDVIGGSLILNQVIYPFTQFNRQPLFSFFGRPLPV
jgi:hypothetical protein